MQLQISDPVDHDGSPPEADPLPVDDGTSIGPYQNCSLEACVQLRVRYGRDV